MAELAFAACAVITLLVAASVLTREQGVAMTVFGYLGMGVGFVALGESLTVLAGGA